MDILTAIPSVGSYRYEPMTAAEIDAHPDCDRIWATVAALNAVRDDDVQDMFDRQNAYEYDDEDLGNAVAEALNGARHEVLDIMDRLKPKEAVREWCEGD